MKPLATAGLVGLLLALSVARLGAQEPAAKTAAPAAAPAQPRGPIIAPSKPVVAPGIAPRGDSGALPTAARSANARTISVSARQAAEQTIAALVAAMKNMPKRPPAPPESRTSRARRATAAAEAQAFDAPPPIVYRVTWPATPDEPGVGRRVELDWGSAPSSSVKLRWND
jgi:hypothetical protein